MVPPASGYFVIAMQSKTLGLGYLGIADGSQILLLK